MSTMRFDHDPITLAPKGFLIEDARVNELFTVVPVWEGVTVEIGSAVSPAGTMDAFKVMATTNSGFHTLAYRRIISAGSFAFSAFVKATGETSVMIHRVNNAQIIVNLQNGALNPQLGASGAVQAYGNGWFRCSLTFEFPAENTTSIHMAALYTPATASPGYPFGASSSRRVPSPQALSRRPIVWRTTPISS
jgi:hypothetical protein